MNETPARRVQLRSGLEYSRQQQQGKVYLVVKDPVTRRYFRFTESQAVILELMNDSAEPIDAETLAARVSDKLQLSVSPVTISAFFNSLEGKFLLDTPAVRDKLSNISNRKQEERNFLYWKLASVNPERIFAWLLPRTRWAFTPTFHILAGLVILCGFVINFSHWDRLAASTPDLVSVAGIAMIWPVIFSVITIHEFAHGLTCCRFGGKVHDLGFMLIYFAPAFYCDVSDAWMFPSRRQRMWVTFAGGYIQMVIWGLCTLVWRVTDPDTFVHQIALVVVLFSGIETLLNFNPLIKLDGYYMLSDYLEIPNLRTRSMATLWNWIAGKKEPGTPRQLRAQLIYGVLSVAFSTTLLLYVYSALYTWSTSTFALAGLIGFMMFSTFTLRKTVSESMAGVRAVATRASVKKYRNAGIVAAVLLVGFLGRWELRIPAEFRIIAQNETTVRAQTEGVIVEVMVREGTAVRKGDVLARLRDFEKQQQVNDVSGLLQQKRNELALLMAGARPEEIDGKRRLIETRQVEVQNARRNQEQRNQLQQTLERRRSELQLDQQNLRRNTELFASGLIARAELDRAETAVKVREREISETEAAIRVVSETGDREADLKERELAEAESELRLMLAGSRPELIRERQAEVAKLESQVRLLDEELEKTDVRAPIDGIVATSFIERKLSQRLEAGDEFCRIVDTRQVTVEMQVPEKELAEVKPGNRVLMKIRSYPTEEFEGRVDFIAPVAQAVSDQPFTSVSTTPSTSLFPKMVIVRSELNNDNQLLKPEMTGVARIYCGDRRIADLVTRRLRRWIRTEFWYLLP